MSLLVSFKRNITIILFLASVFGTALFQDANLKAMIEPDEPPSPLFLGPVVGYNKSMHFLEFKNSAQEPIAPTLEDASGNGYFIGLGLEYLIGEPEYGNTSIIGRLMYNSLPATSDKNKINLPTRLTYIQGNDTISIIEESIMQRTNSFKYDVISFDLLFKYNPWRDAGLGFTIGPTFDYAIKNTQDQRLDLIEPSTAKFIVTEANLSKGYRYINDDRTIVFSSGEIPNSNVFRLGIKIGLQYDIHLDQGMVVFVPSVNCNFGITNLSNDFNWRINAIQIGLDVRFSSDLLF